MLNITALIPKNQNKATIYCDKEGLQLKISLAKFYFTCQSNFIFLVFFTYFHFENKHFVKKSIRFFLKKSKPLWKHIFHYDTIFILQVVLIK